MESTSSSSSVRVAAEGDGDAASSSEGARAPASSSSSSVPLEIAPETIYWAVLLAVETPQAQLDGQLKSLVDMGLERGNIVNSFGLKLQYPGFQKSLERLSLCISQLSPVETLPTEVARDLLRSNLIITFVFGEPNEVDQLIRTDLPRNIDDIEFPCIEFAIPLIDVLYNNVLPDSPFRGVETFSPGKVPNSIHYSRSYRQMAQDQAHISVGLPSCWSHGDCMTGVMIKREDDNFLVDRLREAEHLYEEMVTLTHEKERETIKNNFEVLRATSPALLTQGPDGTVRPETNEEREIRLLGEMVDEIQVGIGATDSEGLDDSNPQVLLMKKYKDFWSGKRQGKGEEKREGGKKGEFGQVTYPRGFIDIDIVYKPAHLSENLGDHIPLFSSVMVQPPDSNSDSSWINVKCINNLQSDMPLINMLIKNNFVVESKSHGNSLVAASPVAANLVKGMKPNALMGPATCFGLPDFEGNHVVDWNPMVAAFPFYIFPTNPSSPCPQKLRIKLRVTHPLLHTTIDARCIIPWRQIAAESGLLDSDDTGLTINTAIFANGVPPIEIGDHTFMGVGKGEDGTQWDIIARPMPCVSIMAVATKSLLDPENVRAEIFERSAHLCSKTEGSTSEALADTEKEQEQEQDPTLEEIPEEPEDTLGLPDELVDSAKLVSFHGLYLTIIVAKKAMPEADNRAPKPVPDSCVYLNEF